MSIEVKITPATLKKVDAFSSELNMRRDDFIVKAVKKYLHILEMNRFRNELKGVARKKGFKNEKEVLASIS